MRLLALKLKVVRKSHASGVGGSARPTLSESYADMKIRPAREHKMWTSPPAPSRKKYTVRLLVNIYIYSNSSVDFDMQQQRGVGKLFPEKASERVLLDNKRSS